MSPSRRRSQRGRQGQPGQHGQQGQPQQQKPKAVDLWEPRPPLPPFEPIDPVADPTATLRSLGVPPLYGHSAGHYLAAVVERAAVLATGLAASAGLLSEDDDSPA